ncbi:MAG: hypothetical protein RLZZ210_1760 [Pseudomonadota bacterium]|jgi:chromosome segregation protein
MHLNAIKLSGFKSFVDNTQFDTNAQCVGVVGPNGCGKSNIMDAVRWVLGESRAGELRGESMQDVIFNGSTSRKPSYKAMVELVFDNTSGRLQGEWGRYAEVSVKRSLSRDGASNYYINNQVVRRRDIYDMFMGTGLGPKAYAIIGQGMISQIIEAKPEEMRVFLEEAAGVSKYKERRKETQARLQDTQENLLRIQDLIIEISTQLEKLDGQAGVARQYKSLQKALLEYEYLYYNWHIQNEQKKNQNLSVQYAEVKTQIEELNTNILNNELEQTTLVDNNALYLDQLQEAQNSFNAVNQHIMQLEERKRYQSQQQETLQNASNEAKQALNSNLSQLNYYQEQKEILQEELEELAIQQEIELEQQTEVNLDDILEQEKSLNNKILNLKDSYQQNIQQSKLLEQKQQLLLQNISQKYQRYQKLEQEFENLQKLDGQDLSVLEHDLSNQKQHLAELNEKLAQVQTGLQQHQGTHTQVVQKVQNETIEMNRLQAHLQAIQGLHKTNDENAFAKYIDKHKNNYPISSPYDSTLNLSSLFKANSEWEQALATVLQHKVSAWCVDISNQELMHLFNNFVQELDTNSEQFAQSYVNLSDNYPLEKISADSILNYIEVRNIKVMGALQQWLGAYHISDSMEYAIQKRASLPAGHAFILKNGMVIDAFSVTANHNIAHNALVNKRKIEDLQQQIKAQQLILEQAQSQMSDSLATYNHLQQSYQELQQKIRVNSQSIKEQELALDKLIQQQEFAKTRLQNYEQDLYELRTEMSTERETHAEIGFNIEDIQIKAEEIQEQLLLVEDEYNDIKKQLEQKRQAQQQNLLKIQALNFKQQTIKQNLERNLQDTQQARDTISKAKAKISEWEEQINQLQPHILEQTLQTALEEKVIKEQALHLAQNTIGEYHHQVQILQQKAKEFQSQLLPLYDKMHKVELNIQEASISQEQYQQHLDETIQQIAKSLGLFDTNQNSLQDFLPSLDELSKLNSVQSLRNSINNTKQAIDDLGSVNLSAIEELEQTQQRFDYLNQQLDDIQTAITTLENAIAKIDEENRILLLSTFNTVNEEFGKLFPELFGGGQAKLTLIGDDILSAGVQVMAQPPGKKNATIHLLSGGEKALTAIALVFAIFALNPAPFCLLDEVDAPLDDANTERYAKLIKRMSENTQFLFISHNKIAMEIAEQLIGVTMQEQGVSRIVSVDMIEAVQTLSS